MWLVQCELSREPVASPGLQQQCASGWSAAAHEFGAFRERHCLKGGVCRWAPAVPPRFPPAEIYKKALAAWSRELSAEGTYLGGVWIGYGVWKGIEAQWRMYL